MQSDSREPTDNQTAAIQRIHSAGDRIDPEIYSTYQSTWHTQEYGTIQPPSSRITSARDSIANAC
jgi:hypothetical protein